MSALISVIIPIYKVEDYLPRCIDSIINQSYKNLEIILVDDGSPDNCGKICDDYAKKDSRIRVIHKQNGGVSSARNAALDIARGDYIAFVDSDDYIESDMYAHLYNNLIKYKADVSICGFLSIYSNSNKTCERKSDSVIDIHNGVSALQNVFSGDLYQGYLWNKLFKKSLVDNQRFDTKIKVCEDSLFCTQVFVNAKSVVYDSVQLYNYFRHSGGVCSGGFTEAKYTAYYAFEKMREQVKGRYEELIKYIDYNELRYGVHLLSLLFDTKIDDKNKYLNLISINMKKKSNKTILALTKSKTTRACVILNFIHVKLTYVIFYIKKHIIRRR